MASLTNGGLSTQLGFHELKTEQRGVRTSARRGWADQPRPAGPGLSWPSFGPIFSMLHLLHFGSLGPSIVGFGRHYLHDQVEGSLGMNFRSFHLGPQEFSIQAHWSLPALEASSHTVGAP
jgi:hypothetical protein